MLKKKKTVPIHIKFNRPPDSGQFFIIKTGEAEELINSWFPKQVNIHREENFGKEGTWDIVVAGQLVHSKESGLGHGYLKGASESRLAFVKGAIQAAIDGKPVPNLNDSEEMHDARRKAEKEEEDKWAHKAEEELQRQKAVEAEAVAKEAEAKEAKAKEAEKKKAEAEKHKKAEAEKKRKAEAKKKAAADASKLKKEAEEKAAAKAKASAVAEAKVAAEAVEAEAKEKERLDAEARVEVEEVEAKDKAADVAREEAEAEAQPPVEEEAAQAPAEGHEVRDLAQTEDPTKHESTANAAVAEMLLEQKDVVSETNRDHAVSMVVNIDGTESLTRGTLTSIGDEADLLAVDPVKPEAKPAGGRWTWRPAEDPAVSQAKPAGGFFACCSASGAKTEAVPEEDPKQEV